MSDLPAKKNAIAFDDSFPRFSETLLNAFAAFDTLGARVQSTFTLSDDLKGKRDTYCGFLMHYSGLLKAKQYIEEHPWKDRPHSGTILGRTTSADIFVDCPGPSFALHWGLEHERFPQAQQDIVRKGSNAMIVYQQLTNEYGQLPLGAKQSIIEWAWASEVDTSPTFIKLQVESDKRHESFGHPIRNRLRAIAHGIGKLLHRDRAEQPAEETPALPAPVVPALPPADTKPGNQVKKVIARRIGDNNEQQR